MSDEDFQTAVEFKACLANRGIELAITDATKTTPAMEFLRTRITSGPAVG